MHGFVSLILFACALTTVSTASIIGGVGRKCPIHARCTEFNQCLRFVHPSPLPDMCGWGLEKRVCCWERTYRRDTSGLRPLGEKSIREKAGLYKTEEIQHTHRVSRKTTERGSRNETSSPQSERVRGDIEFVEIWRPNQPHHVVGGRIAHKAEFSYMAAIGYLREKKRNKNSAIVWGCGGSLISKRYVLTAAHCISDAQRQKMQPAVIRVGTNELSAGARLPSDFSIEAIALHPKYKEETKYFDLALLRTERPVAFSADVSPVALPSSATRVGAGSRLLVAGWGATDPTGYETSALLKTAELLPIDQQICKKLFNSSSSLPHGLSDDMICVADPNRKSDTCLGDSGGPLVVRAKQQGDGDGDGGGDGGGGGAGSGDVLVGVTSFGAKPCASRRPGVYALVRPHLPWIRSVVDRDSPSYPSARF